MKIFILFLCYIFLWVIYRGIILNCLVCIIHLCRLFVYFFLMCIYTLLYYRRDLKVKFFPKNKPCFSKMMLTHLLKKWGEYFKSLFISISNKVKALFWMSQSIPSSCPQHCDKMGQDSSPSRMVSWRGLTSGKEHPYLLLLSPPLSSHTTPTRLRELSQSWGAGEFDNWRFTL